VPLHFIAFVQNVSNIKQRKNTPQITADGQGDVVYSLPCRMARTVSAVMKQINFPGAYNQLWPLCYIILQSFPILPTIPARTNGQ